MVQMSFSRLFHFKVHHLKIFKISRLASPNPYRTEYFIEWLTSNGFSENQSLLKYKEQCH